MDATLIVVLVVALLVILAVVGWLITSKRKSQALQERFGSEYERTLQETGGRSEAEKALEERATRVEKLHIKELSPEEQGRFSDSWKNVQGHFVDEPAAAIGEADRLIQEVMNARGYPVTDFEQQADDISVNHPEVVKNYRAGHELAQRHEREGVETEGLRQAMLNYRALFDELLGSTSASANT